MKKVLIFLCLLAMVFALAGCSVSVTKFKIVFNNGRSVMCDFVRVSYDFTECSVGMGTGGENTILYPNSTIARIEVVKK